MFYLASHSPSVGASAGLLLSPERHILTWLRERESERALLIDHGVRCTVNSSVFTPCARKHKGIE